MLHPAPSNDSGNPLISPLVLGKASELALVVEDEAMIGLDLCDGLESCGYVAAGPFTHCCKALAWLQRFTPSLAILDYALRDGSCMELMRELRRRRVPLLIYSGHRRTRDFATEFPDVPWLGKPAPLASVLAASGARAGASAHLEG